MARVKLTIEFDNVETADHFATWLCEQGEQDYWAWMEQREQEETGDITAMFDYHKGCFNKGADKQSLIIQATSTRLDRKIE